ncbi:MAG: hypothetical protein IMZ50_16485 [Candidatus Atribacteria bacterium]|nr:hypothetical protein [Candidatus Atribacteria bacterium]
MTELDAIRQRADKVAFALTLTDEAQTGLPEWSDAYISLKHAKGQLADAQNWIAVDLAAAEGRLARGGK